LLAHAGNYRVLLICCFTLFYWQVVVTCWAREAMGEYGD